MLVASVPAKFPIAWAASAGGGFIRAIPTNSQIGIQNGAASLTDGFPPLNFDPVSGGGVPPFGQDMNGILNQVTLWNQWQSAGGPVFYDAGFSTSIGGYPKGAVLSATAITGNFWISTVDNNTSNPDTGGANWTLLGLSAIQMQTGNYAVATGTNNYAITLTPAPASYTALIGVPIRVQFLNGNTSGATLNVNGLGNKNIFRDPGHVVILDDILAGEFGTLIYDGTQFIYLELIALGVMGMGNFSAVAVPNTGTPTLLATIGVPGNTNFGVFVVNGSDGGTNSYAATFPARASGSAFVPATCIQGSPGTVTFSTSGNNLLMARIGGPASITFNIKQLCS